MSFEDFLNTCLGKEKKLESSSQDHISDPLGRGSKKYMTWLNDLVGTSATDKALKDWTGMMPTHSESQFQRHMELINALWKTSPKGDIELEMKKVPMTWDNKKNTVQISLHFKRRHKMYAFTGHS